MTFAYQVSCSEGSQHSDARAKWSVLVSCLAVVGQYWATKKITIVGLLFTSTALEQTSFVGVSECRQAKAKDDCDCQ